MRENNVEAFSLPSLCFFVLIEHGPTTFKPCSAHSKRLPGDQRRPTSLVTWKEFHFTSLKMHSLYQYISRE